MKINGIDIADYGAKLLSREISHSDTEIYAFWPRNALRPYISPTIRRQAKELDIEIEFKGAADIIETNKSLLLKDLAIPTIKFAALPHYYKGYLTDHSITDKLYGYEVISVKLLVVEEEEEVTTEINATLSATVHMPGNGDTPVRLEVTPSVDVPTVTIEGLGEDLTLTNLTAGKTVIIADGTVTEEGVNKYADYDSWGFPMLVPGDNAITVSVNTLAVKLIYCPRWL
ncbi:MAG: hypothetical protein K0M69_15715 [Youngiibacter sp.]|nr:hypothetical protein [Youngiibacter sp.]